MEYIAVYEPKVFFGISIADWIQIFILLAALLAFFYPRFTSSRNNEARKDALRSALLQEMLQNIQSLFSDDMDRPFLLNIFDSFLANESRYIKDESKFQELIALYVELIHFNKISDQFRYNDKYLDDEHAGPRKCINKQMGTINSFLQYFEEQKVYEGNDLNNLIQARKDAQKIRNEKQEAWHKILKENIEKII